MAVLLTKHARKRILERLIISPNLVIELLETDKAIPLGYGHNTQRLHKLFYSEADDAFFIAVQDMKNLEVVTILPLTYHNAFPITLGAREMAKELACPKPKVESRKLEVVEPEPKVVQVQRPKLYKAFYFSYSKKVSLGEWPCEDFNWDMSLLLQSELFASDIKKALDAIPYSEASSCFYLQSGKGQDRIKLPWITSAKFEESAHVKFEV